MVRCPKSVVTIKMLTRQRSTVIQADRMNELEKSTHLVTNKSLFCFQEYFNFSVRCTYFSSNDVYYLFKVNSLLCQSHSQGKTNQPKMVEHHKVRCKESLQHSRYPLLGHNSVLKLQEPCNKDFRLSHWTFHLQQMAKFS